MGIRNITPNDLPALKNLVGTDDFTDICYEYSKISINDDGEITSFVISTPKSIKDYLGEVIPLDELCFKSRHYYEGMEYWVRNTLEDYMILRNSLETKYIGFHMTSQIPSKLIFTISIIMFGLISLTSIKNTPTDTKNSCHW